jgi:hypothetical protein
VDLWGRRKEDWARDREPVGEEVVPQPSQKEKGQQDKREVKGWALIRAQGFGKWISGHTDMWVGMM